MSKNAAIVTTLGDLKTKWDINSFTEACHNFVENDCRLPVGESNDKSWQDCYQFLYRNLPGTKEFEDFYIAFEFIMPESLARADVVLMTKSEIIVLEFKQKGNVLKDDITQAANYGRSIKNYHFETEENELGVSSFLVYTLGDPRGRHDLIKILSANFIIKLAT